MEGESERLSHQLIKSLTADSSWGLAAAAAASKQTLHGARKTGGKKHQGAKSRVFVPPQMTATKMPPAGRERGRGFY